MLFFPRLSPIKAKRTRKSWKSCRDEQVKFWISSQEEPDYVLNSGLFRCFYPSPTDKVIISPWLMLSWAVWFKFLFNKDIANTYLFTLTSFSKQSFSSKVLEICELCALYTDSQKTYSVNNTLVATATASTGGGGIICRGEITEKTLKFKFCFLFIFKLFISCQSVTRKQ